MGWLIRNNILELLGKLGLFLGDIDAFHSLWIYRDISLNWRLFFFLFCCTGWLDLFLLNYFLWLLDWWLCSSIGTSIGFSTLIAELFIFIRLGDESDDKLLLEGIQEIKVFDLFKIHPLNEHVNDSPFLLWWKLNKCLMIIDRSYLILQDNLNILALIGLYSVGAVG